MNVVVIYNFFILTINTNINQVIKVYNIDINNINPQLMVSEEVVL